MNKSVRKNSIPLIVAFLMVALLVPAASSANLDNFRVITFTPQFFEVGDDRAIATFKGIVNIPSGSKIGNAWFEWGDTSILGKRTSSVTVGNKETPLYRTVSNLDRNKFYYYRAVAQDSFGTVLYGDTIKFRVSDGTVTTTNTGGFGFIDSGLATNIYPVPVTQTRLPQILNTTTVILHGSAQTNASVSTSGYFKWGTTPQLELQTPVKNLGALPNLTFSEVLTGLTPGTVYYYKAEVVNPGGRVSGAVVSFTTTFTPPVSAPPVQSVPSYPASPIKPAPITSDTVIDEDEMIADNEIPKNGKEKTAEESRKGFFFGLFGGGDDEPAVTDEANGQEALAASTRGGFFPNTIFGWIVLTILIVVLVMLFMYVKTLHERVKTLQEERERAQSNNLHIAGNGSK